MGEKYRNLIDRIIYGLVEDKSIDMVDVEAYKFGLEVTILKAVHYVSYIVIALCMNKFLEFVIVFSILYAFRRNTGGFHAKTRIGCYLFSCAVIFLSLLATKLSFTWWGMTVVSVLDLILLLILSPIQHINRRLDAEDITYFRRRLKIISLAFIIIYAVTSGLGGWYLVKLYTIGFTMVTILTVLGKLESLKQSP
ncbi:MAG: accessory gene regulator B family protein [Lachnospiraceae bacterium]|nr:accessory gene regulator B family protein [Lachnospiraceae bacterium]